MTLLLAGLASASPTEFYGFGARKMGRAAAGTALPDGTDAILANPAALPGLPYPELALGFVAARGKFADLPQVWWDTNQDGVLDELDEPLEVGPGFDPVNGFLVAVAVPVGDRVAGGLGLFLPTTSLLRLETFEPTLPTYFLYDNRAQRYELGAGVGVRPAAGLAVGVGVQMIPRARFQLDATLEATLAAAEEGDDELGEVVALRLDAHRMTLDLVPGFGPQVAVHWDAGEAVPALDGLMVGGSWRGSAGLPVDVTINLQANLGTEPLGDLEALQLPLLLGLQLGLYDHYVPGELNLGVAYVAGDTVAVSVDLRRTAWDRMQLSIAEVTASSLQGAMIDLGEDPVQDGNPFDVTLRPTYAPRAGVDARLPAIDGGRRFGDIRLVTRGGLGYEPSPLVRQTADTALLDSPRVIYAVGAGVEHDDPLRPKGDQRVRWDGFLQYHHLRPRELSRPDPGGPAPGYPVDGSAYPIGGHLLAGGMQWSIEY